jgi:hypothetical protein
MVLVFGSFILGGQVIIEMFGVGLASAVLLDALIVRSIIVPALMLMLGKANWWLPRALDGCCRTSTSRAKHDKPGIDHQRRDLADSAHVLDPVGIAEPEVLAQAVPDVVAIKQIGPHAGDVQALLDHV